MVLSTSNLVETFIAKGETCDALSRSVGELDRKYKYGGGSVSVKIRKTSGAKLIKPQILLLKNFTV